MREQKYLLISATIFAVLALLHVARLVTNLPVQFGTVTFPIWGSWLVSIVAAALSIWAFRLMSQWQRSHS
jgi:lipopolysaccharide export LptBFGC system permease protein LptF